MNNILDEIIREALDLEDSIEFNQSTLLADIKWDSMAQVSLMVIFDDKFNKELDPEKLSSFVTISDLKTYLSNFFDD
jgi:acyl carrier protein